MLNVSNKIIEYNNLANKDFRVTERDLYADDVISEYSSEVLDSPMNFVLDKYYRGMQLEDFRTVISAPLKRFEKLIREYERFEGTERGECHYRDDETLRDEMSAFSSISTIHRETVIHDDALAQMNYG